ncbi:MAG: Mrp/NBP35 family ATP-binding protein [Deltaproteobacteria bacterium]|nr:Mrp/NBP35 family ATP-binding protein [Deltaproteobacteria bacterium]
MKRSKNLENKITTPADLERTQQDLSIKRNLKRIKRKIFVMSGKGGVGKSTVASMIALLLSIRGNRVGLMDVDLHGPSIPNMIKIRGGMNITGKHELSPFEYSANLGVISMGMILQEQDDAVIWRGPLKISAIRQFISDVTWGELDFLIVDSPPGTGDEPLTVAQTITDAEALIVTTPQEISLADVRKSINFCRQLKMNILGVVENMSGLKCPHCGEKIAVFSEGGGKRMSGAMDVPFIGEIPIDPEVVRLADERQLEHILERKDSEVYKAYMSIIDKIEKG